MPTYEQNIKHYEDGFGMTELKIRISDTYDGLTAAVATTVTIIQSKGTEEKIEQDGKLAVNNYEFMINTAAIENADDQACFDLVKTALNPAEKVFMAAFHDTAATPDLLDNKFIGVVLPEEDRTDLKWNNAQWNGAVSPVAEYSFTCQPFSENMFEKVDTLTNLIAGIDTAWETANVSDRWGWFDDGSGKKVLIPRLVSLNKVLRILADNMETALAQFGTFNIVYERCVLDATFFPARWHHTTGVTSDDVRFVSAPEDTTPGDRFTVNGDDGQTLAIDPDGPPANEETIWISYSLIKPVPYTANEIHEIDPEKAKEFLWTENKRINDSFTKLIYLLAENFGLIPIMEYSAANTITIKFITKKNFVGNQVFVKDATAAKMKFNGITGKNKDRYTGKSSYNAPNGHGWFSFIDGVVQIPGRRSRSGNNNGEKEVEVLLTISPTYATLRSLKPAPRFSYPIVGLPYNHQLYTNGAKQWSVRSKVLGVHTAIYMYVPKRAGQADEPNNYFTPCAQMAVKIDDVEMKFDTFSDYLNYINYRDENYFEAEYTLEVPGWNYFSINADGSNASIKSLKLGSKIVFDTIEYLVTKIKINHSDANVSLLLNAVDKFAKLENAVAPIVSDPEPLPPQEEDDSDPPIIVAGLDIFGQVYQGCIVSDYPGGKVEFSSPLAVHQTKVKGFSMDDGLDTNGDKVRVITAGPYTHPFLTGSVGDKVYLRKVSSSVNASKEYLVAKTADENLFLCIGRFIDTNIIDVEITQNAVML